MSFEADQPAPDADEQAGADRQPARPGVKISPESEGTPPTVLLMGFSGNADLELDVKRGMEVQVTVTGKIVGHAFTDHYDRERNLKYTAKLAKLKIEDVDEVHRVQWKDPRATPGQTSLDVDGEPAGEDDPQPEQPADIGDDGQPAEAEVVDGTVAEDAPALDAGDASSEPAESEPPAPEPPIWRHPQIAEEAWNQLNADQRTEVDGIMAALGDLQEYLATRASNPTDEKAAHERSTTLIAELKDEFGIELIPAEKLPDDDTIAEPVPNPADRRQPTEELLKRRGYLVKRRGLPPEAEDARKAEIALIDKIIEDRGEPSGAPPAESPQL